MASPSAPIPRLFRLLVVLVAVCILGLVAGIVLVSVENARTSARLDALEQYVAGKGEQRDQDNARLREQLRQAQCDLLDTFQAGLPALERARQKYGCGPGIPIADLAPKAPALPSTSSAHATSTHPAEPAVPAPITSPPPAEPTPGPPSPGAPTSTPGLLCRLLPLC